MITKTDIFRMARHAFRRSQGIPDRHIMHADREWLIGLLGVVVAVGVGSVVTTRQYFFYQALSLEAVVSAADEETVYRAPLIESLVNEYSNRLLTYQALVESEPVVSVVATTTIPIVLPEGGEGGEPGASTTDELPVASTTSRETMEVLEAGVSSTSNTAAPAEENSNED